MPVINENGRTLAGVVTELKDEMKEFFQTRLEMLRSELKDKVKAWKTAVPLVAIALVMMGTAWLVLTAALISIIAVAFLPSPFAYFLSFIIVGVVYMMTGAICAIFAFREIKEQGFVPERTVQVLKDDKLWIETETRRAA